MRGRYEALGTCVGATAPGAPSGAVAVLIGSAGRAPDLRRCAFPVRWDRPPYRAPGRGAPGVPGIDASFVHPAIQYSVNSGSGTIGSGVRQIIVAAGEDGQRLDNWLAQRAPGVPRSHVYRIIRRGEVRVDGGRAKPTRRVREGETVRVPPLQLREREAVRVPDALAARLAGRIALRHEDFLVLDKPAGLAVHGGTGLAFGAIDALRQALGAPALELVHRLDRGTSGALVVATDLGRARELQALFRERSVDKRYLAIAVGAWPDGLRDVNLALSKNVEHAGERRVVVDPEGAPAHSRFEILERLGACATLLDVAISTGRTHQIRVHARASGHALAGDVRYGDNAANARLKRRGVNRLCLHARAIGFTWRGERFDVEVPPDAGWREMLSALRRG